MADIEHEVQRRIAERARPKWAWGQCEECDAPLAFDTAGEKYCPNCSPRPTEVRQETLGNLYLYFKCRDKKDLAAFRLGLNATELARLQDWMNRRSGGFNLDAFQKLGDELVCKHGYVWDHWQNKEGENKPVVYELTIAEAMAVIDEDTNKSDSEEPPPPLWKLDDGGFRFRGVWYDLASKPLELLRIFVDQKLKQVFPMSELHKAWTDSCVSDSAVKNQLSRLREVLQQVALDFDLAVGDEPLPYSKDAGGWKFLLPR